MTYFKTVPPGTILPFAGSTPPAGWLLCDGSAVSRTLYVNLFEKISTNFGSGDGATTFHLPDMRGRFERCRDGGVGRDPDRASRTSSNSGGNTGDTVGSAQDHAYSSHAHTNSNSVTTGGESVDHSHGNTGYVWNDHGHDINGAGDHNHGTDDAYYSENWGWNRGFFGSNHGGNSSNSVDTTWQNTASAGWHNHDSWGVSANHSHGTGTVSAWHTHSIPFNLTVNNDGGNETRPINANLHYVIKI